MIERYTRPEMGAVWSEQRKLDNWLEVELAVVDALAEAGVVPGEDADAIRERAAFTVDAVKEREKVTDHDVAAFVDVVAASVGEEGRWFHHGLTSSDVLDTALGLQLQQAGVILVAGRPGLPRRAGTARARARRHDLRRPHAWHPGRAHHLRREARRVRVRGRAQPPPASGRGQAGVGGRAVRGGRDVRGERAGARGGGAGPARRWRARTSRRRWSRATGTRIS